jgi:arylsulfatase A-like enzyme
MRSYARSAYYASRVVRGRGDLRAADSLERIREWAAERQDDRPSFLFVNLIEAHAPYLTPRAAKAVRDARSGPMATFRAMLLSDIRHYVRYNLGGLDRRRYRSALDLQRALQRHAAAYLDEVVQGAVRAVRRPGRPFAVVVTSDHGESFGDHEAMWHGFTMDEPGLHVPLVVSGDGVDAAERPGTVGVREAYATVLDLAGLDAPAGASPSLLSNGQARVTVSERLRIEVPPWAMMSAPEAADRVGRLVAVYADGWKLSVTESGERLFHLASDPDERTDRAGDEPDRAADLRRHVPAPAHAEGAAATLSADEEAEVARHLADLGYLD